MTNFQNDQPSDARRKGKLSIVKGIYFFHLIKSLDQIDTMIKRQYNVDILQMSSIL